MAHRIRYAMRQEPLSLKLDGIVEIDDTWIGGKLRRGRTREESAENHRKATTEQGCRCRGSPARRARPVDARSASDGGQPEAHRGAAWFTRMRML